MQHKNALPLWLWVLMVLQAPEQSPSHLALLFSAVSLLDVIALPGRFSLLRSYRHITCDILFRFPSAVVADSFLDLT